MLFTAQSLETSPAIPYEHPQTAGLAPCRTPALYGAKGDQRGDSVRPIFDAPGKGDAARHKVEISPPDTVRRQMVAGQGLAVELVQSVSVERVEHRFCAPVHLLVACQEGAREDGETTLGNLPRSALRGLRRKLTFVPAGQLYHDWQRPRTPTRLIYFYFEPAALQTFAEASELPLHPRLFFEDQALWESVLKLKRLAEAPAQGSYRYFEALGAVLIHELLELNRGPIRGQPPIRGGLAPWQQRIVTSYIEEHLSEPIPLQTLAELARLSPHYFCRAFKQSFGLPPHRYHSTRRIERAKMMLASSACSVTEIGLKLGFSETSSFSTAFRKATGLTPTAYHRSVS